MFIVIVFYILTITAIFVLRIQWPHTHRPYKAIGYPYLPIVYLLLCVGIEIILLIFKPIYTWPGLLILLAGVPIYYFWKKLTLDKIS